MKKLCKLLSYLFFIVFLFIPFHLFASRVAPDDSWIQKRDTKLGAVFSEYKCMPRDLKISKLKEQQEFLLHSENKYKNIPREEANSIDDKDFRLFKKLIANANLAFELNNCLNDPQTRKEHKQDFDAYHKKYCEMRDDINCEKSCCYPYRIYTKQQPMDKIEFLVDTYATKLLQKVSDRLQEVNSELYQLEQMQLRKNKTHDECKN